MKKNKTIEEVYSENEKGIEELIRQLKQAGVKDKTIKLMLNDIRQYQNELFKKAMINTFERMKTTFMNNIFDEDFIKEDE